MLSQQNISAATPNGANLVEGGATFRVCAPRATAVYLNGSVAGTVYDQQTDDRLLGKDATGYWTGFQAGAQEGDQYRFWVAGTGSNGYKRDPLFACVPNGATPRAFIAGSLAFPGHLNEARKVLD